MPSAPHTNRPGCWDNKPSTVKPPGDAIVKPSGHANADRPARSDTERATHNTSGNR
jgi:hypothetical protein